MFSLPKSILDPASRLPSRPAVPSFFVSKRARHRVIRMALVFGSFFMLVWWLLQPTAMLPPNLPSLNVKPYQAIMDWSKTQGARPASPGGYPMSRAIEQQAMASAVNAGFETGWFCRSLISSSFFRHLTLNVCFFTRPTSFCPFPSDSLRRTSRATPLPGLHISQLPTTLCSLRQLLPLHHPSPVRVDPRFRTGPGWSKTGRDDEIVQARGLGRRGQTRRSGKDEVGRDLGERHCVDVEKGI